ncbi:unnamed protein product [Microthlaspi erraticum]|uniref:F-box domain-containing protein n=1 Tax=Microthlaspi erraticum TaxID=1685480 RepID=A0A6D2IZ12_9BRAS|nr:unnamed protein product [Microthlaspi erraticum]
MNEHQEKRRKIQTAITHDDDDDRPQINHIPLDLIWEILSRLPAKSIVRHLCVSKLWSSYTKHQSFIKLFATRSSERPPRILLTFLAGSKRFVFSIPQEDSFYPPEVESYQMTNPQDYKSVPLSECVHGLVLLDGLVIWNPSMRRFLKLPKPKTSCERMYLLGYDPLESKHKVLQLENTTGHAKVLTLGTQEKWRTITKGITSDSPFGGGGRCINGILYYSAFLGSTPGDDFEIFIVSFHVRSEKFNRIKIPKYSYFPIELLLPYEGSLALVIPSNITSDSVDLYILKDADGHEWMRKTLHVPSHRDKREGRSFLRFHGVTAVGELIFATSYVSSESLYILYFDPRRNSIREALFEGIFGDEFLRRYGLSKGRDIGHSVVFPNHSVVFPNHMESLVCSL